MIGWRDGNGRLHRDSLFGVFAALARGDAWSFAALRPHQREPWHAFTCQVAAMALIRPGRDTLPVEEAAWHDLLMALTPEQPTAWSLVEDDWTKPALLQPPMVAPANRADYKNVLSTPDALDMLVTSKNHDVKQERFAQAQDEDWLFALVTLQTMEGIMGKGQYGISRMFGGFGNRMTFGIRPMNGGSSAAFRRDVGQLVRDARRRADRRHGIPLLWTVPWDGTRSLAVSDLDELYVEICRRIRLRRSAEGLEACATGSKCARVAGDRIGGNTDDPWMPLVVDTKKGRPTEGQKVSLTPTGDGFGYRQMANILNKDKVTLPLLALLHEGDDPEGLAIVASALVRGQGKTEGLHRRVVGISQVKELANYGGSQILDRIGGVAMERSKEAGEAGRRLRRALILLVQGGPDQARFDDEAAGRKVEPWVRRFDRIIDREFFGEAFWAEVAETATDPRREWRERLRDLAGKLFDEAAEAAPRTVLRRARAIARGRSMLDGQMFTWLQEVA